MDRLKVRSILKNKLNFSKQNLEILDIFCYELLKHNKRYNLIGKSTEKRVWDRHILDSAQLVNFINFKDGESVADLGSGAGFPGFIIAIFNQNPLFHVKLYEKSNIKADFLEKMAILTNVKCKIFRNSYSDHILNSRTIVCRAFKKFPEIMKISREIVQISHKLIVLKGKNAQIEINKAFKEKKFHYKMENSITDKESKIVIVDVIK